jgi:hypothetical protein
MAPYVRRKWLHILGGYGPPYIRWIWPHIYGATNHAGERGRVAGGALLGRRAAPRCCTQADERRGQVLSLEEA